MYIFNLYQNENIYEDGKEQLIITVEAGCGIGIRLNGYRFYFLTKLSYLLCYSVCCKFS